MQLVLLNPFLSINVPTYHRIRAALQCKRGAHDDNDVYDTIVMKEVEFAVSHQILPEVNTTFSPFSFRESFQRWCFSLTSFSHLLQGYHVMNVLNPSLPYGQPPSSSTFSPLLDLHHPSLHTLHFHHHMAPQHPIHVSTLTLDWSMSPLDQGQSIFMRLASCPMP